MSLLRKSLWVVIVLGLSFTAVAQTNSNIVNVSLSATLNETLTVALNSGGTQSISSIVPSAVNNFSGGPVNLTTTWVLKPGRTAVALYAYFDSATAAMAHTDTNNTVDIPAAAIKAQVGGAGVFNALSNNTPFGPNGAGLQLFSQTISGTNRSANRTDNVALELDLSGTANGQDMTQLPADVYTGTMHIRAQATP